MVYRTAAACVALVLCLVSCQTPTGGAVRLGEGATAEIVDTGADADSKAVKLDKTKADTVNVSATYGALDRNVARICVVAGLVALSLFLLAWAAPSPDDMRLVTALYLSAGACVVAALVLAWRFFL